MQAKSVDRFFFEGTWEPRISLAGEEAHHLARVLRAQPDQWIELFNGRGESGPAQILSVKKNEVVVELGEIQQDPLPTGPRTVVAVASPKGDRLRWLVEKVTEIGLDELVLLKTERSVVQPGEQKIEKLKQTSLAACKQCGRNRLMEIGGPLSLAEIWDRYSGPTTEWVMGDRGGESTLRESCNAFDHKAIRLGIIGPEGGLTEAEIAESRAREAQSLRLAPFILRSETAAVAMALVLGR